MIRADNVKGENEKCTKLIQDRYMCVCMLHKINYVHIYDIMSIVFLLIFLILLTINSGTDTLCFSFKKVRRYFTNLLIFFYVL